LSYRSGSFKQTGEFTFTRYSLFSRRRPDLPLLRSALGIIEIGAPDAREDAGDRTVGTARYFVSTNGMTLLLREQASRSDRNKLANGNGTHRARRQKDAAGMSFKGCGARAASG
jgi:hypothetical protein